MAIQYLKESSIVYLAWLEKQDSFLHFGSFECWNGANYPLGALLRVCYKNSVQAFVQLGLLF